jgi:hypothetical protein
MMTTEKFLPGTGRAIAYGTSRREPGVNRNILRHPGLVPGSTVPRYQRPMGVRDGGCRDEPGMTVEANRAEPHITLICDSPPRAGEEF